MSVCKRCRKTHTEEELEEFYTGWMKVYRRNGIPLDRAEMYARQELKKHAPESSGPPWYIRLGARVVGGKDMSNAVKKSWDAVDGYKTKVGAGFLLALTVLPAVVDFLKEVGLSEYAVYAASALTIVGAAHKVFKKFFPKE